MAMNKKTILVLTAAALAVAGGLLLRPAAPPPASKADSAVSQRKAAVEVTTVTKGPIRTLHPSYGVIESQASVDLAAQTPGQVTRILFKEGDWVKAGQPLIKLDDRSVRAQLEAARAASDHDRALMERSMRLAQKGIKSKAAVEDSRTSLVRSQAEEQVRQADLSLMTVTAPFAGFVGPAKVEVGGFANAGQPLVHLEDRSRLRVTFRVAEKLLPQMRPGLPIEARADSIGPNPVKGTVIMVDPTVEPESRSVLVRAELSNAGANVYSGLFVHIGVVLAERADAVLVPKQALMSSLSGSYVYRVDQGVARRVKVALGEREGNMVEITGGLQPGDTIVAAGQFKLEEGMAVETTPFTATP